LKSNVIKYGKSNIEKLNFKINNRDYLNSKCRKNPNDFTRKRKLTPKDLVLYNLNNKGKTTKMELNEFIEKCGLDNVSDAALLKQREKLNEEVFKDLNDESMFDFYNNFQNEVKTFKGHLLLAKDGCDIEVPNTLETRQRYLAPKSKNKDRIARATLSNCYDVLNHFILDTRIRSYKYNEIELANIHTEHITSLIGELPSISIRDRAYLSLSYIYRANINKELFVIRIPKNTLKIEQRKLKSNDEWVEIDYQYDRIRYYLDKDLDFYNYYKDGSRMKVRIVKIPLSTGEEEILITNLDKETFSTDDINYIYQCRWGIETSYGILKNSMMLTNISSSKDGIIKQEIYATMLVHNILQGLINDVNSEIEQDKYKHKMKINFNMAVGFTKKYLILILLETDVDKRQEMSDLLFEKILANIIPIRLGRKNPRKKNNAVYNKYPINKRKSY